MIDTKRILLIVLGVLFTCIATFGQPDDLNKLRPKQVKSFVKNALRVGDIYSAIDYLEHYCKIKSNDTESKYQLAELYRASRDYKKAKDLYLEVYNKNKNTYGLALFYHAQIVKMDGEYKEAEKLFKKFIKSYRGADRRVFNSLVKNEIKACKGAPQIIADTLKVDIAHLGTSVNKAHIEFSPISVDKDKMIYASLVADKIEYFDPKDENKKMPVRKFFAAEFDGEQWNGGLPIDEPFNQEDVNTGNGTYSIDGNRFYFTKTFKSWKNQIISEIWVSHKEEGVWQSPVRIEEPINDLLYTTTQPTVGVDAKRGQEILYFVSDRPGGKGGLDVWCSAYDLRKERFKKPRNCGTKINTVADEMSPYYDQETRKMYFSSMGWPGLGGFDVFKTTGGMSKWSKPKNIGFPINTGVDDIYFTVSKDRSKGFFTSNREGGVALKNPTCCDDIYEYEWLERITVAIKGLVVEKIPVYEDATMIFASSSSTEKGLAQKERKIKKYKKVKVKDCTLALYILDEESEEMFLVKGVNSDTQGNYLIDLEPGNEYKLVAEKDGYFNDQALISTKKIFKTDTLIQNYEIEMIPQEPIVLDNIYYEFDKAALTDNAKTTVDTTIYFLLRDNPDLIVELSSHTDSKGNDEYNQKLSQNRAESVVKYLVKKGIDKERLVAKGYGEAKPVASNKNPDGTDNPEGRQKNRRTEFKVIGSSDLYSRLNVKRPMSIKKQEKTNFEDKSKKSKE